MLDDESGKDSHAIERDLGDNFVHDQLETGRKLRVLTVIDIFSRFSPALEPPFSFRRADVVEIRESARK